jgi:hypothetical protein
MYTDHQLDGSHHINKELKVNTIPSSIYPIKWTWKFKNKLLVSLKGKTFSLEKLVGEFAALTPNKKNNNLHSNHEFRKSNKQISNLNFSKPVG